MSYSDFTLERVEQELGVLSHRVNLFAHLTPVPVPTRLQENLSDGMELALINEKGRSEFIVAPILLASRKLCGGAFSIYSGQSLNVDPDRGLVGECDFILARTPPEMVLRAPLAAIVEAKRADIELGIGQCAAQLVGMRLFNERAGQTGLSLYGCVTTGDVWQFLKLDGATLSIDLQRYYLRELGMILAALKAATT